MSVTTLEHGKVFIDKVFGNFKMGYYCNKCNEDITADEYHYSLKKFKRVLCMGCQSNNSKNVSTPEEEKLYNALKKAGVPAKLNKYDGYKHIDIAIPKARVNIEVDGGHHNLNYKQALADLKRTYYSFKKGYLTLRIPNSLIRNQFDETVNYIVEFLNESVEQTENDDDF